MALKKLKHELLTMAWRKKKDRMPRVKPIMSKEYVVRPFISPDGRTVVISAAYNVYFIDPITMSLYLSVGCQRSCFVKMTDSHVFVKHTQGDDSKEWTIISFKGTNVLTENKCSLKVEDSKKLQYFIAQDELETVYGIYASGIDPKTKAI